MRILDLATKDLLQIFRDKKSFLFLAAMPIIFTLFMGFAYNSGEDSATEDTRMPLAWVDEADNQFSELLYERLDENAALSLVDMEEASAMDALARGEMLGVLVIPSAFGEQAEGTSALGQITLVTDTVSTEGQSLYQLLRVPVSQLASALEIGTLTADLIGDSAEFAPAYTLAWEEWDAHQSRSLVRTEKAVAPDVENWFGDNPYNQASPGILVQFAIIGLITSAQILVEERKNRTLQRLMSSAMRTWEIVAGHMLAMFVLVFFQTVLLVVFGQWVLDVNYLHAPLATLLVTVALGIWVASMGLLIGVVAKTDDQVILFSMIAMFFFSALGGTWFPLDVSAGGFAAFGSLMPSYAAMTGLQNILIRGLGLASIWQPVGVLLVYALGFFLLAIWRFRKIEN